LEFQAHLAAMQMMHVPPQACAQSRMQSSFSSPIF
jgi:hypothetical protein